MREIASNKILRGILPYAATVASLSLAVTLRVEHSCTGVPATMHEPQPPAPPLYAPFVASASVSARPAVLLGMPGAP
jgi:hypothetical protein